VATKLDGVVRRSLAGFLDDINASHWTGKREREAISLYVLGHLQYEVDPSGPLRDATQIGIEVPVQQLEPEVQRRISGRRGKPKEDVAKDLVIWPEPRMTTWAKDGVARQVPLAIMEWKLGSLSPFEHDVAWLEEYSRRRARFTGYAVSLAKRGEGFAASVARVYKGARQPGWLVLD